MLVGLVQIKGRGLCLKAEYPLQLKAGYRRSDGTVSTMCGANFCLENSDHLGAEPWSSVCS